MKVVPLSARWTLSFSRVAVVEWFGHENWGVPTGGVTDWYVHVQLSFCPSDTYTGQLGSSWAQVPEEKKDVEFLLLLMLQLLLMLMMMLLLLSLLVVMMLMLMMLLLMMMLLLRMFMLLLLLMMMLLLLLLRMLMMLLLFRMYLWWSSCRPVYPVFPQSHAR